MNFCDEKLPNIEMDRLIYKFELDKVKESHSYDEQDLHWKWPDVVDIPEKLPGNQIIEKEISLEVQTGVPIEQAFKMGAIGIFGEKDISQDGAT